MGALQIPGGFTNTRALFQASVNADMTIYPAESPAEAATWSPSLAYVISFGPQSKRLSASFVLLPKRVGRCMCVCEEESPCLSLCAGWEWSVKLHQR